MRFSAWPSFVRLLVVLLFLNGRASLVLKVAASKGHSQKRSIPVSRVSVYGTVFTPLPRCSTLKQSSRTNVLLI